MPQSTYEEIYPEETKAKLALDARKRRIRSELKNVHLTRFTVAELPALCKLLGLVNNSAGQIEPTDRELKLLEGKIFSIED